MREEHLGIEESASEYLARVEEISRKQRIAMNDMKKRIVGSDGASICGKCVDMYSNKCNGRLCPRCFGSIDMNISDTELILKNSGKQVAEKDIDVYRTFSDPVTWARAMFGWEARWYQEELLRCTALKKVVRAGRRIGKTWALGVDALWRATTKPMEKIVIIAPLQSQVSIVFQVMRELIAMGDGLVKPIRDVNNPMRMEFANGSYILGITAGTRTGMKGDKARGEDATAIYLDEADYLDQKTLESLLAIYASTPDCFLWASSTPTGARQMYWEWCIKKDTHFFKEFHYQSNVSPAWSIEIEHSFREMYSELGYLHEFDAEFGDQVRGVYQQSYIDDSLTNYRYHECKRKFEFGYIYALGVDWNAATNGVHIVGVEYSPITQKLTTVIHDVIDAIEFTQTKAVEHIIELHAKWKFDVIYVDKGFGDTQIEQLHLFGQKHPSSKLGKIVRGVAMQEQIPVRDPFTKKEVKKNAKHLMVEMSARRVESGQCIFPKMEDIKHGLVWQMRNFEAEKISRDGIPVYNTMEDHALVAWQLAILGLLLEFTYFGKVTHVRKVGFADIHGSKPKAIGQEADDRKRDLVTRRKALIAQPRVAPMQNSRLVRNLRGIGTQGVGIRKDRGRVSTLGGSTRTRAFGSTNRVGRTNI